MDRNNKKMIGDDMVISYKVGTNFIKYPVKSMVYNYIVIEWKRVIQVESSLLIRT